MRVLLYNFVQTDDPAWKQGGGVSVYQANLIRALRSAGHEVITLSSGDRYDLLRTRPWLETTAAAGVRRAIIHNSPVFAPAHATFHDLAAYSSSTWLDAMPKKLRRAYGDIDVLHFQNTEGLTAGFFRALRKTFPDSRILLSAHNYNLVCPQVNLWFREHRVCEDFREGRACVNCLISPDRKRHELNLRRMESILRSLGLTLKDNRAKPVIAAVRLTARLGRALMHVSGSREPRRGRRIVIADENASRPYAAYRQANLDLVREVFDEVLAVSERTRQVLIARGVSSTKVAVSYIGTGHHDAFMQSRRRRVAGSDLHIAFLGYMRADKGFYFLLEGLRALPPEVASRLRLTIAAPVWESYPLDRLKEIAERFGAVVVLDGYKQADLAKLLEDVDLGIVPVLWEDNLPQVAIEFVAHGVPILTSDRGGAQEIAANPAFIFHAGSTRDFCAKLGAIASGRVVLGSFWAHPPRIFSMDAHLQELMRFYARRAEPAAGDGWRPSAAAEASDVA